MRNLSSNTVLDLGKVSYADFVYRNDRSKHEWKELPKGVWINGYLVEDARVSKWNVKERRYDWIPVEEYVKYYPADTFTPVFKAQLSNSHSLEFTGKKAFQLWALYRKRIGIKKSELKVKTPKGRVAKDQSAKQPQLTLDFL